MDGGRWLATENGGRVGPVAGDGVDVAVCTDKQGGQAGGAVGGGEQAGLDAGGLRRRWPSMAAVQRTGRCGDEGRGWQWRTAVREAQSWGAGVALEWRRECVVVGKVPASQHVLAKRL